MVNNRFIGLIIIVIIFSFSCAPKPEYPDKIILTENWDIKSSAEVQDNGERISKVSYIPEGWYPTTAPSTVLGALVENDVYPDPYYGTNITKIPGQIEGRRRQMPEDSPFNVPWWYRTTFNIPSDYEGETIWLHLQSINYKANVWINGNLIADTTAIEGSYRLFDLDITRYAVAGERNCLAFEILPPKGMDLTITWVDWNPTPPDRGMGIWYDLSVSATGPVSIKNTQIITDLDISTLDNADLTISTDLTNSTENEIKGILKGKIESIEFSREVSLQPGETRRTSFSPEDFSQLRISNPRLWWPYNVGPQNLYDLELSFEISGRVSDSQKKRFGIRKITTYMNKFDTLKTTVFQINGKNIVIRGGGYVEDMMLRPDKKKVEAEIQYAKQMNLNTLRMEAPRGSDYIFDLCDEQGIMLIVGWCCCSSWERWNSWTPHIADIARESLKDQVLRLRNHPSVIDWLYGSDGPPPAQYEQPYMDVLNTYDGTRPYQSSATQDSSDIAGFTGLWMGPFPSVYAYQQPTYWYGKYQFNTEAGPSGEQIAPVESMKKMMPEEDLWPISDAWNLRLHNRFYPPARTALYSRYGEPKSLEEYSIKSQALQLEATKAMFEAFSRNKYRSSGIIYWMYNSAWPSLYWQFFDYYLTPNGSFYGARKGNEPLHVLYAYDDSTIYVANSYYKDFTGLKVSARVYNENMDLSYSKEISIDVTSDDIKQAMKIEGLNGVDNMYFLKLELKDQDDKLISDNFYWLSAKGDDEADFTALDKLAKVDLNVSVDSAQQEGNMFSMTVSIKNPSSALAFAINPKVKKSESKDLILPVYWDDNYLSLLPGEIKTVKVHFDSEDLEGEKPYLEVAGWNINPLAIQLE